MTGRMTVAEIRRRLVSANHARIYAKQREQRRRYSAAKIRAAELRERRQRRDGTPKTPPGDG